MKASVETITPDMASEMLKFNAQNRKLNESQLEAFTSQMERGAWVENGASVVMNGKTLLDGQHRLMAIRDSGVTQDVVVVRDVASSAFSTIDTGTLRRLKDVLSIEGEELANHLSTALVKHYSLTRFGSLRPSSKQRPNHDEMLAYHRSHPFVKVSVEFVASIPGRPLISVGVLSALHAKFAEKDPELADRYVRQFVTGEGIKEGDPVGTARARLITSKAFISRAMTRNQMALVVIVGWNATRDGRSLTKIAVKAKGKDKNRAPVIK